MGRVLTTPAAAAAAASDDEELKTSWPEVVGWVALNASMKITSDRPDVTTPYYSENTPLPPDYNPKRVIIVFNDYGGVVIKTPVIG